MKKVSFAEKGLTVRQEPLQAAAVKTLQVNLGDRCNMRIDSIAGSVPANDKEVNNALIIEGPCAGSDPSRDK